jgi:hypothetical protein
VPTSCRRSWSATFEPPSISCWSGWVRFANCLRERGESPTLRDPRVGPAKSPSALRSAPVAAALSASFSPKACCSRL